MNDSARGNLRILLADGHALFRGGMRLLLNGLPIPVEVTEVANGAETLQALRSGAFDLILLEHLMADRAPGPLLAEIRSVAAGTPLMVVSAADQPGHIQTALEQGAAGFVPKTSAPKVMLQAVMLVLAGGVYLPREVLGLMLAGTDRHREAPTDRHLSRLTARHRAILCHLANGLSNKQIAHQLGISEGTVKSHLAGLLKALGVRNRTHAIVVAKKAGWLAEDGDSGLH